MICPNINSKDYKALVSKYGKREANRIFAENNFVLPRTDSIDKPNVYNDSLGRKRFMSVATTELLNKRPSLAKKIINKLALLYPDVNIMKGGLFDENGKWVEIAPGEKGMHYRNAFVSGVAWANDSYLETPPHEYAHHYIDMFRNTPIVREGIQKYGEERLVTIMGRYFADQEVSSSFKKYAQRFWDSIKSFLGMQSVADILSKAFYEGEQLSDVEFEGSAKFQYQKEIEHRLDFDGYVNITNETTKTGIKRKPAALIIKELNLKVRKKFKDKNDISKEEQFKDYLSTRVDEYIDALTDKDTKDFKATVFTKKDIKRIKDSIKELGSAKLYEEFIGKGLDKDYDMSKEAFFIRQSLIKMEQQMNVVEQNKNHIIVDKDHVVGRDFVSNRIESEVYKQQTKRLKAYEKIPAPLRPVFKKIENFAGNLIGPRLVDKFLSGGLDTMLSKVHYQSFNKAEDTRLDLINKVDDILSGNTDLLNSSLYLTGYKSIDNVKTTKIKYLHWIMMGDNQVSEQREVDLTDDEMLQAYLIYRQNDKREGHDITPRRALIDNGFFIDQNIIGDRNGGVSRLIKLNKNDYESKIVPYIEEKYGDYIAKIDQANELMYDAVNTVFEIENGVKLEKIKNYFPLQYKSTESVSFSNENRMIDHFKSAMLRPGNDKTPFNFAGASAAMEYHKKASSVYSAYSIPLRNSEKIALNLKRNPLYNTDKEYKKYVDEFLNHLKRIGNAGVGLSQLQTDRDFDKWLNRITSNFSVSVLALNFPVMMKQPVSFQTAASVIDSKYLKKAGYGIGGMVGISPKQIIQSLVNTEKDAKWYQWEFFDKDEYFQEMIKNSPKMKYRAKGYNSRETGEAFIESMAHDMVSIPFMKDKEGNPIRISKKRLMEGIKVFDMTTITHLYKAVSFEAQDLGFKREGTAAEVEEYNRYCKARIEEIVELTQPTYDPNNRTNWSHSTSPIIRMLTMFGSARSKVGMVMIEKAFDYIMNPTKENLMKLGSSAVHTMGYTALVIASINALKAGLIYGFDEPEDKILKPFGRDLLLSATGGFYGLSDVIRMVASNLDDAPWTARMEHPLQVIITAYTDAFAAGVSLDPLKFLDKTTKAIFYSTGLPAEILGFPTRVVKGRELL